jgi:hypothetical protein
MPATADLKTAARFDRTAAAILAAAAHVFSEQGTAAAHALTELANRLNDAGLQRATVPEAIERLARALVAVGDRYAIVAITLTQRHQLGAEEASAATTTLFLNGARPR